MLDKEEGLIETMNSKSLTYNHGNALLLFDTHWGLVNGI